MGRITFSPADKLFVNLSSTALAHVPVSAVDDSTAEYALNLDFSNVASANRNMRPETADL